MRPFARARLEIAVQIAAADLRHGREAREHADAQRDRADEEQRPRVGDQRRALRAGEKRGAQTRCFPTAR